MKKSLKARFGRVLALGLSAAMMSALALVGAAPAVAAGERYVISGTVNTAEGSGFVPLAGVEASVSFTEPGESGSRYSATTQADGSFSFSVAEGTTFPAGDYAVDFALDGYDAQSVNVTIVDADVVLDAVTLLPTPEELAAGTVTIDGTPVVGNVLTAVTAGWPTDATLSYEWFYSGGQFGGAIDGQTGATYTVTSDVINRWVGVIVTGSMAGYSDTTASALLETVTSAPKKAAAPAPTDLAGYLQASGSTPQTQASAGLPAGTLNPGTAQTATLEWLAADSFVDVYVFSSPVYVGTFPVVNGAAQITLSTAVLAQLAAGNHTLLVTGQSSGAVQSVALSIGLPVTGADVTLPVTIASILLLLGASLLFVRRRFAANA